MKRILLMITMTLALPALIWCQTNGKNAVKKGGDEQAARQTLNDLIAGLGRNDAAALDRIYADNYIFVGDNGLMMSKTERLAAMKAGELKYQSISHEVVKTYVYADTAVIVTRITTKMAPGLKFTDGQFITTGTFVKLNGRWQLVAAHNTRVSEQ